MLWGPYTKVDFTVQRDKLEFVCDTRKNNDWDDFRNGAGKKGQSYSFRGDRQ